MSIFRLLSIVLIAVIVQINLLEKSAAATGFKRDYIISFKQTAGGAPLQDQQLYLVEVFCKPALDRKRKPLALSDGKLSSSFFGVTTTYAASHLIILTSSRLSGVPEEGKLPTDAIAVSFPYSVGPKNGSRDPICLGKGGQQYLIMGGEQSVVINAAVNYSETFEVNPVVKMIVNALGAASPLLRIFDAPKAGDLAKKWFDKATTAQEPLQTLLTSLNKGISENIPLELTVGTYEIKTTYGNEIITVKPVVSLVKSNYAFSSYLKRQLDSTKLALTPSTMKNDCRSLYGSLTGLGFKTPLDRGYATLELAIKAGFEKKDIIDCLSRDDALALVRDLPPKLWAGVEPYSQRFTELDVLTLKPDPEPLPVTPIFTERTRRDLNTLVISLSQADQEMELDQLTKSKLRKILSDSLQIDDQTTMKLFKGKTQLSPEQLALTLRDMNISRFGCFDNAQQGAHVTGDGAVATFLGFDVPRSQNIATSDNAFVFRAFYEGSKINRLVFSKDVGLIDALLANRKGCGELKIRSAVGS